MLEKARTRMCDDGIAADDRYTVQQDRTSLLMLTTIAARSLLRDDLAGWPRSICLLRRKSMHAGRNPDMHDLPPGCLPSR